MSVPGLIACIRFIDARWRRNRATVVVMNLVPRPWSSVMLLAVLALLPASAFAGLTPEEVKAFQGCKVQAEKGDPIAQYYLGNSYYGGNGVVQDYVQAASWYRKAAIQGIASAQYNLGNSYRDGKGVVQDYVQAVSWYRKAIAQGHLKAHSDLGLCYFNGTGVKKNEVEAVSWYRKAADQGDTLALHNLGGCYGSGSGVEKDEVEAYALWYLASITDEVTRKALAEIEKKLPNNVIQLGKTRAKQLQKEINAKIAAKKAGK